MVVLAGKVVLVTRAAAARGPTADSINRNNVESNHGRNGDTGSNAGGQRRHD